ncbi:pentatricopeptide repeat-containing protein At4g32430, mitochondrial [Nicotiana sylvestris]|uniref:Pentatricopeptide repeat-containing protein At4g32430, mitochondrial n=1 Tax=Nicotiana sylvestris TaxID=4096 RepID=A0A1U7WTG9_NICSY|nr:PREDICTED: pentatricopeptide repeat-containing protein At4g32430, mitochondrial [Nicotiana sylvestris]XP_009780600.1 PREDICTED: pentatricopeptide repeat-containing protein At4g32430, mitochondrial [Nicotiana sylvestris]XP_009780601.1 PREDICTED: pentatricopeptide repeat-containing protein At4g32430, mitochondrial [Nicotiana sylvestris]XP_009780602.1 PREDICTED: pentatricopeptide repeat-containing protein At4g32430, mitochondrial [Nicotiana sylvestris]
MFIRRLIPPKTLYIVSLHRQWSARNLRSIHNAHQVFDKSLKPALVSIHQSMLNWIHQNRKIEALKLFKNQLQMGISEIDEVAIALALKGCRENVNLGSQIHSLAITSGFISFTTVPNSLMSMYCKNGHFNKALCVFNSLDFPDRVSYNTLLSGFENGKEALSFALWMHSIGFMFDAVSYTTALSHCTNEEEFRFGIQLHSLVLKFGLENDVFVGNALVTMYSKWGSNMAEAERVFYEMLHKDLVSWNALLSGYAQEGSYSCQATLGFREMMKAGVKPDHVSFTSAVSACGQERSLDLAKQIHGLVIKMAYGTHVSVCNVLISLYYKCDVTEDANKVFQSMTERNVVSWTTMLSINDESAVSVFNGMRRDGVYPNHVTFVGLIHSITVKSSLPEGQMIHGCCLKTNFFSELNVANSFISMYAKFELMEDVFKVFEELDQRDLISWNALISAYAQNGMSREALQTFLSASMKLLPNEYTFGSVLSAIASSECISLKHGQRCHACLIKRGFNRNPIVSGALLDMYAKRGSIAESRGVFYEIADRSQVSWTAIISAHSRHGDYESVMALFKEMRKKGVSPDSITFLSILTACGRKGMVDMGVDIFNSMVRDYSIEPSSEHYSCMVDMFGRAGRLKEAEIFLVQIPGGPGLSVLQSLLGACRIYGNVEMATKVANTLIALEPEQSGSYVLMSNLFAEKGQWEKVANIRKGMRDKGVRKEIGFSWVDVIGSIDCSLNLHGFSSDDKSHPQTEEIYRMAEWIGSELKYLEHEEEESESVALACII